MPLFDSFSTAQAYRLPKMNSVPTTDDLKYAIAEAQKRIGKTIELPFEHPHNHQLFIVKLNLSVGNKAPAAWSLQRGDGASAVRLWNRSSDDCLMIQNKVKIDSQVIADDAEAAQHQPAQPMSLQVSFGGAAPDINNPLGGSVAIATPVPVAEVPFGQQDFYAQANQQAANAFAAPPQIAPPPPDSWVDNLMQPPVFNPTASKTNMPALHPGTAPAVSTTARPAAPAIPDESVPQFDEPANAPAEPPRPAPNVNLPPPIQLDVTLIDRVNALFIDDATGIHNFGAFVYFLFRAHDSYKRARTPFSVVVFEVALRIGHENVALPGIALPAIIERIRTVLSDYDIVTHLSGGEFAACLPGTSAAVVAEFAQALHSALTSEPLTSGSRGEGVLAAVGMATTPDTCEDPQVLIAAARQAKETAKSLPNPILMFPT